ncbi:uncharacterized protein N7498_008628 [Penicillium cinerascens]|uniref:Uncharacterized protein n=1 Tax=Penicillium cinerascens TaxID=70096 RepID=A0A9W9MAD7_9EURO|nr:uncharacterized protein N7498_008628 [Penicillium cinerascens]KAJ5195190.1 hypothetical protein N7498_008628 [Penicillium cinerascens]
MATIDSPAQVTRQRLWALKINEKKEEKKVKKAKERKEGYLSTSTALAGRNRRYFRFMRNEVIAVGCDVSWRGLDRF